MAEAIRSLRFLIRHSVTYLLCQMDLDDFWLASDITLSSLQLPHASRYCFKPLRHVVESSSCLLADEWITMSIIWFSLWRLLWRFNEIERFFITDPILVKIWTLHYFI